MFQRALANYIKLVTLDDITVHLSTGQSDGSRCHLLRLVSLLLSVIIEQSFLSRIQIYF
jgi:hypothetical protein